MDELGKWESLEKLINKDKKMNKFEHKHGTGSLFKNQFKSKSNHPDFTGKIVVSRDYKTGEEIKFAAWKKESAKGVFLSLSENNNEPQVVHSDNEKKDLDI
jgi:hypothetical protein